MATPAKAKYWVLTLSCIDGRGIVHALTGAILAANGNIAESQQFTSEDTGMFFMRLQIEGADSREDIISKLEPVAEKYKMKWILDDGGRKLKILILVSKAGHCLNDILFRHRAGQLQIEVVAVLGNHPDLSELATFYGVPFEQGRHARLRAAGAGGDAEKGVELVVLARFMQIMSPPFCADFQGRIINIHHSFLPGFKGANPYAQAYARGVKLIGATAHFVTADLDEGPIIEQNVVRVLHNQDKNSFVLTGQDVESK
eukprot:CAMPEP_0113727128 /NCGR_PEP_ID=MMETSP0038_2-20120614/40886_1 /TAXON_ID=2898 /ORGANISM="Cryptomonas paramecium" /LENGTH=256 /DNA_ID=CAMNT_0000657953 /DNA_START=40 /DNA_END=808 /DNA_ORIENTATION=+ /assembly_acc=CAM_ASM_000170